MDGPLLEVPASALYPVLTVNKFDFTYITHIAMNPLHPNREKDTNHTASGRQQRKE